MANTDREADQKITRTSSFGEERRFSLIEALNIWITKRMILRQIAKKDNAAVLDIGCGYNAHYLVSLVPHIASGVGVDLRISGTLKHYPNLTFVQSTVEQALTAMDGNRFDFILCVGILEHLWDPVLVLKECRRVLRKDGLLYIIVPTWPARPLLEALVRLGRIDPTEIDDHKMYYAKRDLWPLLVRAGFAPSAIKLRYRKAGLVLAGLCRA